MKRYLFLTDIDGTLLQDPNPPSTPVIAAAQAYLHAGGLLALCTGRSPIATAPVAQALSSNVPAIVYNGAMLYDFQKCAPIWSVQMDFHHTIEHIRSIYEEFPICSLQVFTTEGIFLLRRNELFDRLGVQAEMPPCLSTPDEIHGEILKYVQCCEDIHALQTCTALHGQNTKFSSPMVAETIPQGAGKEIAMDKLLELLGVPPAHTFGAGDGGTDLPMLRRCAYPFAPCDAIPQLHAFCEIIPSCQQDGMAVAFQKACQILTSP